MKIIKIGVNVFFEDFFRVSILKENGVSSLSLTSGEETDFDVIGSFDVFFSPILLKKS